MFSSVQSLSCVWLFATPWTAVRQASPSITNSQSPPKPMSIVSVMPSNHLILCCPGLPPSIFPSIRVFQMNQLFTSGDQSIGISHQVAKVLEFQLQHQSFQWTPRTDHRTLFSWTFKNMWVILLDTLILMSWNITHSLWMTSKHNRGCASVVKHPLLLLVRMSLPN